MSKKSKIVIARIMAMLMVLSVLPFDLFTTAGVVMAQENVEADLSLDNDMGETDVDNIVDIGGPESIGGIQETEPEDSGSEDTDTPAVSEGEAVETGTHEGEGPVAVSAEDEGNAEGEAVADEANDNEETAEPSKSDEADVSNAEESEVKTYVLDPEAEAKYSSPSSAGEYKVGTDGYFSLIYTASKSIGISEFAGITTDIKDDKKNLVEAGKVCYDPLLWGTYADDALGTKATADRTKCVKVTGGQMKVGESCVKIKTTLPNAKLTVYSSPKAAYQDASARIEVKQLVGSNFAKSPVYTGADTVNPNVAKDVFTLADAGEYCIGFNSGGGIILYMEVTEGETSQGSDTGDETPSGMKLTYDEPIIGAKASDSISFTDENEEAVDAKNVHIKAGILDAGTSPIITDEIKAAVKSESDKIMSASNNTDEDAQPIISYYDFNLINKDEGVNEQSLQLGNGTIRFKLPYPDKVKLSNKIIVLHGKESLGEIARADKDTDGFWIEADSFSPYTVIIEPTSASQAGKLDISDFSGYAEGAYVEWDPYTSEKISGYMVYVSKDQNSWDRIDDELIRSYGTYYRADVLGLTRGTWYIKVNAVVVGADNKAENVAESIISVDVTAHDRSGYAWVNGTSSGAYKENGELKDNANVIYVTDKTKDTVSLEVSGADASPCVGIQGILDGYKKGKETKSLDIRIIGNVTNASYLLNDDIVIENKRSGNSGGGGITVEGIGEDAVVNGWGIRVKGASNVEIRNLGFMNRSSQGEKDNIGLQQDNDHIWVHNCDLFYGNAGSDADQIKGDGALDCKKSDYVTFSYNHFWDSGKCCLLGLSEGTNDLHITYHHNWFDHSDSRHPRVRYFTTHVYNNYYDGNSKYGVGGALGGASIFVENNYFRNCPYPMLISMQGSDVWNGSTNDYGTFPTFSKEDGSIIKAYGNVMVDVKRFIPYSATDSPDTPWNESVDFDAYVASSRDEKVPNTVKTVSKDVVTAAGVKFKSGTGSNTYNNFDTASDFYSYTPDPAENVPDIVTKGAGRVNGGDFKWTFNYSVDDSSYAVNMPLKNACLNYTSKIVSVGGMNGESISVDYTVTFDPNNGDESWEVTVLNGQKVAEPATAPVSPEEGKTFAGWYKGNAKWNFDNVVSGNIQLTALYLAEGEEPPSGGDDDDTGDDDIGGNVSPSDYIHNFTTNGKTSSFYKITGNLNSKKGTVTYKGLTLTQCLKMESSTNITFNAPKDGTLTLVFGGDTSAKGQKVNVNGTAYTCDDNGICTLSDDKIKAGEISITKNSGINLFYMEYVPNGGSESIVIGVPVSNKAQGDVPIGTVIKLSSETAGAKIYYTMTADGSEPTEPSASSTECTGDGIPLGNTDGTVVKIKAVAISGEDKSSIVSFSYTLVDPNAYVAEPKADVANGKVEKGTAITLSSLTEGAEIYYTISTNGTAPADPTASSLKYTDKITINENTIIKAIAIKGDYKSVISTFSYTVSSSETPGTGNKTFEFNPQSEGLKLGSFAKADTKYGTDGYFTIGNDADNGKAKVASTGENGTAAPKESKSGSGITTYTSRYQFGGKVSSKTDARAIRFTTYGSAKVTVCAYLTGKDSATGELAKRNIYMDADTNKWMPTGEASEYTFDVSAGSHGIYVKDGDVSILYVIVEDTNVPGGSSENPDPVKKTYTITVDKDNGDAVTTFTVNEGEQITSAKLPDPAKEGYTFVAWVDENGKTVTLPHTPTGNMTLKAEWKQDGSEDPGRETYTVNFVAGEGTLPDGMQASVTAKAGQSITLGDCTPPSGQKFIGWQKDGSTDSPIRSSYVVSAEDAGADGTITFNAVYAPEDAKFYKVTLDTDGGTLADGGGFEIEVEENGTITIGPCEKAGYVFKEWTVDGEAVTMPYKVTKDVTLKATYEKMTYSIAYEAGSGTAPAGLTASAKAGDTIQIADAVPSAGYTFKGWSVNGGAAFKGSYTVKEEDAKDGTITITAVYEEITYTVRFDADGGTLPEGMQAEATAKAGDSLTLGGCTAPAGKKFVGWMLNGNEGDLVTSAYVVNPADAGTDNTIAFKALYAPEDDKTAYYKVTLDTDGGTLADGGGTTRTVKENETIDPGACEKAGYVFKGWTVDGEAVEVPYKVTKDVTLKAVYEGVAYSIVYQAGSGTAPEGLSASAKTGDMITLADAVPAAGYTFKGWSVDGGTTTFKDSYTVKVEDAKDGVITIKAVYEAVTYKVKFDAVDGTLPDGMQAEVTAKTGDSLPLGDCAAPAGQKFIGWMLNGSENNLVTSTYVVNPADAGTDNTITFKALYASEADTTVYYTVTLDTDGGTLADGGVTTKIVKENETIDPGACEKAGYVFKEWTVDGEAVVMPYLVTKDVTLKAVYTLEPGSGEHHEGILIVGLEESYDYTGANIVPNIGVVDYDIGDGVLLKPGVDYTVKYKDNKQPGKAKITVTGKGNYAGKDISKTFMIEKVKDKVDTPELELLNLKGAKLAKIDPVPYTGEEQHPDFTLTLKGGSPVTYKYNADSGEYETAGTAIAANVALSNNVNKGTATILITGTTDKNKLTQVKKTFKITPVDLSKVSVDIEVGEGTYSVKGAEPSYIKVKYGDKILKNGTDYTVKYSSNKKAGQPGTVTVTGKGNYAKKCTSQKTYVINKLDMGELKVEAVTAYTGLKAGKVKATVVDGNGNILKPAQYTLNVYKSDRITRYGVADELKAADAEIYVEAVAKDTVNLAGKTEQAVFTVGENIAKAKVKLNKDAKTNKTVTKEYTGSPVELEGKDLTVTIKGVAKPLEMGVDYEIAYADNIKKGTATAVIKGIGTYSGSKTVKFKIVGKNMRLGEEDTTWDDISGKVRNFMKNLFD